MYFPSYPKEICEIHSMKIALKDNQLSFKKHPHLISLK